MTKREKIFLWLTPLPVALCASAYLPVVQWLIPTNNVLLSWMPVNIGLLLSMVLLVTGMRWTGRAFWRGRPLPATALLLGTLLGGVPALGLLWIFVMIALGLFAIHQ